MDSHEPAPTRSPELQSDEEVLDAFVQAACLTLREIAGTEAGLLEVSRRSLLETAGDISVILRLDWGSEGALLFAFPQATAAALAQRTLAEVTCAVDETMIRDCAGEIGNVTAGQAKALLHGTAHHFSFSTPLLCSAGQPVPTRSSECLEATFASDAGSFAMRLYLGS